MPSSSAIGLGVALIGGLALLIFSIFKGGPPAHREGPEPSGFSSDKYYGGTRDPWEADDSSPDRRRRRGKAECAICKTSFSGIDLRSLPCGHVFHDKCLTQWFMGSKTCPTCRRAAEI